MGVYLMYVSPLNLKCICIEVLPASTMKLNNCRDNMNKRACIFTLEAFFCLFLFALFSCLDFMFVLISSLQH